MTRLRADRLLVERGLFESRAKAQAAIAAGLVTADQRPVKKPSDEIAIDAALRASPAHPWVSRGGIKLAHALDTTGIAVAGKACLDVGASTGGFTEVLLTRGARHVTAVDVGRAQLHPRLRDNAGITSIEATDIRALDRARLTEPPDLIVADVSFISLKLVLPAALALAATRADLVALIKPQFEAPRRAIKKGIVRDEGVHAAVCGEIAAFVASLGWSVAATFPSPITGGDGNREFFVWARRD
jgi:23S rRNA (cytidine1920-2'-O)/16S rRNA (cytidine1409-2'-O)-methyltransferase